MSMQGTATAPSPAKRGTVRAVVTSVEEGRSWGWYAVTHPRGPNSFGFSERVSITFSANAWEGEYGPEEGQIVELEAVQEFARGWRAKKARPVTQPTNAH